MTNHTPLVSVLLCTYNPNPEYFKAAINSVLSQTYFNLELIIVNDGSSTDVSALIEEIKDERIVFIDNKENKGLTRCLNQGLVQCNGEYIARMDDDDICENNRIERQLETFIRNEQINVLGSDVLVFGDESRVSHYLLKGTREEQQIDLFFRNVAVPHPSVMIRRSFLEKYELKYNENFVKAQDYGLWMDCVQYDRIYCLSEVLLQYRVHKQQASKKNREQQIKSQNFVREEQLSRLGIISTESEIKIHTDFCEGTINMDFKELNLLGKWILKLEKGNRTSSYLNHKLFKRELGTRFATTVFQKMKTNMFIVLVTIKYFRIILWHFVYRKGDL